MAATSRTVVDELCFTARALAQTHPMSEPALRYRQHRFDTERRSQPFDEAADWASTALLVGYCLRRAEERAADVDVEADVVALDDFAGLAAAVATTLTEGDATTVTLLAPDVTVRALDRLIESELGKRHEHVREQLDDAAWAELEQYVTWWVVHGYAVRVAECS